MKLTKATLKRLIKEELLKEGYLQEGDDSMIDRIGRVHDMVQTAHMYFKDTPEAQQTQYGEGFDGVKLLFKAMMELQRLYSEVEDDMDPPEDPDDVTSLDRAHGVMR